MKQSNPNCSRGISLAAHRRGLYAAGQPKRPQQERNDMTYFEWLFSHPIANPRPVLMPVRVRAR